MKVIVYDVTQKNGSIISVTTVCSLDNSCALLVSAHRFILSSVILTLFFLHLPIQRASLPRCMCGHRTLNVFHLSFRSKLKYIRDSPSPSTPYSCGAETCSNGLDGIEGSNSAGDAVCCPLLCNQCGGRGCRKSGGSTYNEDDCCVNSVLNSQENCSVTAVAPCVINRAGTSYTTAPSVYYHLWCVWLSRRRP